MSEVLLYGRPTGRGETDLWHLLKWRPCKVNLLKWTPRKVDRLLNKKRPLYMLTERIFIELMTLGRKVSRAVKSVDTFQVPL